MRRRVPVAILPPRDPEPGRKATRRELEARILATICAELLVGRYMIPTMDWSPNPEIFTLLNRLSALRQAAELELETGAAMRHTQTLELF